MTQKNALDLLMMGKNIYLTGQAGSGKTYVLNQYIDYLKKNKVSVAVTATTGIAATHLNGTTIHSWSGIGIKSNLTQDDLYKILANKKRRETIKAAKVLIIDEISMLHGYRLDMVNQICTLARQNPLPFGGLQVVLCGDFFQLPPINEPGFVGKSFAYESEAWEDLNLTVCYLTEQHRQLDDGFLRLLNEIRSQEVNEYTYEKLTDRMGKILPDSLIPTKLYTHNLDVDSINALELRKIDKPAHTFPMITRGKRELIETLKKGCLAPEELVLKEGALVMFIKNNPVKGYVNGTLGIVYDFDRDGYPKVQTYTGKEIVAQPTSWVVEEDGTTLAEICQIPLRLAWAITVHKSQGMSLDTAEIDLSKSFAYGMGYVALSRVKSLEGMRLIGINPKALLVDSDVAKFDEKLQKLSHEESMALQNLDKDEILRLQKEYLKEIVPVTL